MVFTKLGQTSTTRSKSNLLLSLLLVFALSLLFDVFSGGDDRRTCFGFVEGKSDGGVGAVFWLTGGGGGGGSGGHGSQSNVGIAIAVTVMAGLAVAATIVYSNRGHLQSPWSRRRRKHALQPKQWKSLFDEDGRLCDGGVKFLKKVRSGGVHPSLRAEVWPFLLGVYDLKSSKEERDAVKIKNREEYEKLRKQCQQTYKLSAKTSQIKETCESDNNKDDGQVLDPTRAGGDKTIVVKETRNSNNKDDGQVLDPTSDGGDKTTVVKETRNSNNKDDGQVLDPASDGGDETTVVKEIPNSNSKDDGQVLDASSPNNSVSPFLNQSDDHKPCDGGDGNEITCKTETESSDSDSSEEADDTRPEKHTQETDTRSSNTGSKTLNPYRSESFATWQRIIRLDAIRANAEWVAYSPSQAAVSSSIALESAESVCLKDYNHLEACRIFHAARLVSILEAYALYDSEIGYCQGMSDLLSPIISVVEDDSEAFWCFVGFMKKARHNFRLDEVGIRRQLNIVSKIIKGKDSHLYRHLEELQAEDCFFVYRMVVVLFRRELNFEQTLCLWEVMWADQTAIRAGITKSAWGRMRVRAPPTDDLLLYAIAACVLQRRKQIIDKYSSMDEILRECNSMAGHLDVWKLLDDAHDLVVNLHDKI
ncbi:putative Rab-GTPase-TBC domain-containing protein [Helianthus annuus]|uniref:Putative ypt/Rab-GAP domain of gyp1p superfamily protein n=1 Tax=Helianthus annuus TaxID=4232 RepID=A0A251UF74_HELAN|nr:small G protein signaling modulator 1 isoform X1 [Helianthus annuus]KAF5800917.1 putative Rab-GTPase-TBC domain-containing protein [Helianthus annuus]KAJ0914008.1 putative Rab-GTPase-TBC domain-containing protein [Helianthus annuus]